MATNGFSQFPDYLEIVSPVGNRVGHMGPYLMRDLTIDRLHDVESTVFGCFKAEPTNSSSTHP